MAEKGFTLVELMVVILIVAIIAAVAIPVLRGQIDTAKWSEGKAMMGSIATAIRAWHAQIPDANYPPHLDELPIDKNLLKGNYFGPDDFSLIDFTFVNSYPPEVKFRIRATKPSMNPTQVTYDSERGWLEKPSPALLARPFETFLSIIVSIFVVLSAFYIYQLTKITGSVAEIKTNVEHLQNSYEQVQKVIVTLVKEIKEIKHRPEGKS